MAQDLDFRSLWMALQPIVDLHDGHIAGHEALVRGPVDSPWSSPAEIFAAAERSGTQQDLEGTCRQLAIAVGQRLRDEQRLFLNVDERYAHLPIDGDPPRLRPERVAIELSEQREIVNQVQVLEAVYQWRHRGYTIVLDDYGTGHASLATLLAVQPDIIKVDRQLIQGLPGDTRYLAACRSLVQLAQELGIEVIAEGIERADQVAALRSLGVWLGQGFFLGRPERHPATRSSLPRLQRTTPARPTTIPAGPGVVSPHYETFFHTSDLPAYFVDRKRTILQWNTAAEALTGWSAQDVVGRKCMAKILDHTTRDGTSLCWGACPLVHCMADGKEHQDTILLRHHSGQRMEVQIHATPVRDAEGSIVGAFEVFQPTSDEKEHAGEPGSSLWGHEAPQTEHRHTQGGPPEVRAAV